jgi:CheY-like chemotaxis protein
MPAPAGHTGVVAKILVVDDDPMNLDIVAEFLSARGHGVVKSTEGAEAVTMAVEHEPELAVLDYMMPGARGTEVLAALRAKKTTQALPVIFLSGTSAFEYANQVPSDERVRFLHKPVDFQLLSAAIEDLIGGRHG